MSNQKNIFEILNIIQQAKQAQAANTANPNIRDFVGETVILTGMKVIDGIKIKGLGSDLSKVTYSLHDGSYMDSFHQAAVERARDMVSYLGETFPAPLECRVESSPIHDGKKETYFINILGIWDDPENPIELQKAAVLSGDGEAIVPDSPPVNDSFPNLKAE